MELIVIMITSLFICLSMLLSPASATAMQIQELPPLHEQGRAEMHLSFPTLPRKLRFLEKKQAIISAQGTSTSNKEKKDASSAGKAYKREESMAVHESKGTWQEWVEGSDTSISLRWIIPTLKEDAPYITNHCRLVHETWHPNMAFLL